MATDTGLVDRLRRPEYTGENRCVPCTATNLAIAVALAGLAWLALPGVLGPLFSAAVLLVSVAAIALRGYLVPGTPWLTRTYFPDRLLRAFEKEPAAPSSAGAAGTAGPDGAGVDVEAALLAAGAVEACADADDLCLTPDVRDAWRAEVRTARESGSPDVSAVLGGDVEVATAGGGTAAWVGDDRVAQWPSDAALLADAGAAAVLAERYEGWTSLGPAGRAAVLRGLRLFLERCPACDGTASMGEEAVASCCRWVDVVAVTCDDCGARLLETEVPEGA